MRRWLLALSLLLGVWLSTASAQYVRIKIDLNEYKVDTSAGPANPGDPNNPMPGGMVPGGSPMPGVPAGNPPMPGGTGFPPMPGSPGYPGGPNQPAEEKEQPVWVEIRIPISKREIILNQYVAVYHKWGKSVVPLADIEEYLEPSIKSRFETQKKNLGKGSSNEHGLLGVAEWCLQHGMMKEFIQTMDEFEKKYDKHPTAIAYRTVHKKMQEAPKQDDPTAKMVVSQLAGYTPALSSLGHYSLYTPLEHKDRAVTLRLEQLERTYQTFYYWFALRNKVLPQPEHRLVVVLEPGVKEYQARNAAHNAKPAADAGFLSQGQNVVFLCVKPVHEVFAQLEKNNVSYWKELNVSYKEVLEGTLPKNLQSNDSVAKLHTLGLAQKALEEETAYQTTTHEAVQQLLAAADILPRNVLTAEWLRFGLASFFETPRQTFYECSALPSWSNLIYFKHHWAKTKKFAYETRGTVLLKVITDDYFSQAQMAVTLAEKSDPGSAARKNAEEKLQLAHSSSWSLTYFLMKNNLDKIFAYCDQLKQLPRDTEYSPPVLADCFARSFGWPQGNAGDLGMSHFNQLQDLGASWYKQMETTYLDISSLEQKFLSELADPPKKKKQPPPKGGGGKPPFGGPGGTTGGLPGIGGM